MTYEDAMNTSWKTLALKPKMYFMVLKQLFDAGNIASAVAQIGGYDVALP